MSEEHLTKTCVKCGLNKPLDGFYPQKTGRHGVGRNCATCVDEQKRTIAENSRDLTVREHRSEQWTLFRQGLRRCTRCKEVKPLDAYGTSYHSKYGRVPRCKACCASEARGYRKRPYTRRKARELAYASYIRKRRSEEYQAKLKANQRRWHERSPRLNLHMALRHAVGRRKTVNPITTDELMEMWRQQKGKCAVSGIPMTWAKGTLMPTSVSLDRLDGSLGYEKDNVRLVCYQVNTFRGRWSDEQMLLMACAIIRCHQRRLKRQRTQETHAPELWEESPA